MQLVTYRSAYQTRLGASVNQHILDLNQSYKAMLAAQDRADELAVADLRVPTDMLTFLQGGETSLAAAREAIDFVQARWGTEETQKWLHSILQLTLCPPVLKPEKVIGVGMNYHAFVAGIGEETPQFPTLFHKTATALNAHGGAVAIPHVTNEAVPEGELAVIIGKRGKYIAVDDALSYVAGYSCVNDICARDLEFRTSQWTSGKMVDTFGPLGPTLVTTDEIPDPQSLDLKTILNGEVIQHGNTSDMIFSIPQLIHEISSITTLEPGDVIMTGTPSDLGFIDPPIFLQPGDTISVVIEGVGTLTNPIIAEQTRT